MIRKTLMTMLILVSGLGVAASQAAMPDTMHYQGLLTDTAGAPLPDGSYNVTFRLWDAVSGGNAHWLETRTVTTSSGIFGVLLGEVNSLNGVVPVDFDQSLWLGLEVDSAGEMTPRIPLAAAPYSFISSDLTDGTAVRSLNGLTDQVNLVAGTNMAITPSGNSLVFNATGGPGGADADWQVNGNEMYALPSGNVGVGTADPNHDFHVVGSGINGTQFKLEDVTNTGQQSFQLATLWVETALATGQLSMTTTNTGNKIFLLRAQTTGSDLHLQSADQTWLNYGTLLQFQRSGSDVAELNAQDEFVMFDGTTETVTLRPDDPFLGTDGGELRLSNPSGTQTVRLDGYQDSSRGGTVGLYGGNNNKGIMLHGQRNASNDGGYAEWYDESGNITMILKGQATSTTTGSEFSMFKSDGTISVQLTAQETGSATQGSSLKLYNDTGQLTLELDADHGGSNQGRVITDVLEITGGSDLSEQFDVSEESTPVEPGHVVSIDPGRPGELTLSERPYDTRVAGVVSGAGGVRPGMLMGQRGSEADGEHPVALTGRVYVKVDASSGPVEPGDLLTTSSTPGHAMKVSDRSQAQGAILGKAMTRLEAGRGLVLVLVALQ